MANYEMIYMLEQRLPRAPRWARDEQCQNCDRAKAGATGIPAKDAGTRTRVPLPGDTKRAA